MFHIFSYVKNDQENGRVVYSETYTVSSEQFLDFETANEYIQKHAGDYAIGMHCLGFVAGSLDKAVLVSSWQRLIYLETQIDITLSSGARIVMIQQ